MSLYGVLRTGVSGMTAQGSKLSAVADNIANANTNGYKRATAEFTSIVVGSAPHSYNAGGVTSDTRHAIGTQGSLQSTTSATDLAVNGRGFFVVADENGTPFLTRAGSFVPDGDGDLVNAGGFKLMGYSLADGDPDIVANAAAGLEAVNIAQMRLDASPSTEGRLFANLPANAPIVAPADLPSGNAATAAGSAKTSLLAYDNLGNEVFLDMHFARSSGSGWEVAVYDKGGAAPGGGFPYAAGPLATTALDFDPATGALAPGSADGIDIPVPNGRTMRVDMAQMTQFAADFTVMAAERNGSAPSAVGEIEITDDGTLMVLLQNGTRLPSYKIPLADVASPDNLRPASGNVYVLTDRSGDLKIGTPGSGGFGTLVGGAVEQSNVDLATELVSMIEAQRGYSANSKVFQTGAELLDVLLTLKR